MAPARAVEVSAERHLIPLDLVILNLSGGGMLCQVNRELAADSMVQVTLQVRDGQLLTLNARVLHADMGVRNEWILGCRFAELSQADEDALMGYLFSLQAASLRLRRAWQEVAR